MRILAILIVLLLLMTGCAARVINTNHAPYTTDSPETINQNEADDYKLLFIATVPRLTEDGLGIDKLWLYESTRISMPKKYNTSIPEEASEETRKVSNDLRRILIDKCMGVEKKYIVYDMVARKILYTKEISYMAEPGPNPGRVKIHVFSPSLNKALYEDEQYKKVYLVDTITGEEILLYSLDKINIIDCNIVFSEDESKFAFIREDEFGVKTVCVYDLDSNSISDQIEIGYGNLYLSQWQGSKILYNHGDSAFYVDLETSVIHAIGQFKFYPLLSPDGRYLAFSMPEEFAYYESTSCMGLYSAEVCGLYITDLLTNETIKITTDFYSDFIPFLWLSE